jgi:GcrA cell cycle regulator
MMVDAGASWSDERVELLKKLWNDGLSASQIAAQMGGVTRNAVIGKVHRLGLSGRGKAKASPTPRPRKTSQPSAPAPLASPRTATVLAPPPPALAVDAEPLDIALHEDFGLPTSERVTIMELRESMCRWPMGDPTKPEFRFCGARSVPGLPYCTHHARVAYQPVTDRKRDRRLLRA